MSNLEKKTTRNHFAARDERECLGSQSDDIGPENLSCFRFLLSSCFISPPQSAKSAASTDLPLRRWPVGVKNPTFLARVETARCQKQGECQNRMDPFPALPKHFTSPGPQLLSRARSAAEQVGQICGTVVFTVSALVFGSVRCVRTSWVKASFCIFSFFPLDLLPLWATRLKFTNTIT